MTSKLLDDFVGKPYFDHHRQPSCCHNFTFSKFILHIFKKTNQSQVMLSKDIQNRKHSNRDFYVRKNFKRSVKYSTVLKKMLNILTTPAPHQSLSAASTPVTQAPDNSGRNLKTWLSPGPLKIGVQTKWPKTLIPTDESAWWFQKPTIAKKTTPKPKFVPDIYTVYQPTNRIINSTVPTTLPFPVSGMFTTFPFGSKPFGEDTVVWTQPSEVSTEKGKPIAENFVYQQLKYAEQWITTKNIVFVGSRFVQRSSVVFCLTKLYFTFFLVTTPWCVSRHVYEMLPELKNAEWF